MSAERVVICMRWGALYPPVYVNVLHSAVRRHLSGPFRFVCLTNEAEGLDEGIEAFPIPDLGYGPEHWRHGAWPKLSVFVDDLYGLMGRALFIDLDSVIVNSLAPFFDIPGDLVSIAGGPRWRRGTSNPRPDLATGVFSFDLGSQPQIAEQFRRDPTGAFREFGIEQRFVQAHVTSWTTWPEEWVISFKRHLRRPLLVDRCLPPRAPYPGTRIVAFHGNPRPIELARAGAHNWAKFPRAGRGPIRWVRDYWLANGFTDKA
jgi:hypothetical protein